jgi:acetyl esterase/lipase
MRRTYWHLSALLLSAAASAPAAEPAVIPLWPGQAPGEPADFKPAEEKFVQPKAGEKNPISRLTDIAKPTISVYRPAKDKDTGAAVIVAPGGGYNILAWSHEGTQVAEWLNDVGVTAVLLKYRVPRRSDTPAGQPPKQALMDAQRAVSLVRSKAGEWGIDPKRIGFLGFSAGGHLTAWTCTNFDQRAYDAVDDADKVSCRPDFGVAVYPGGIIPREGGEMKPEIRVSADTPPMFLAHAANDPVKPENSIALWTALRKAGVTAELHIYATGGHGFGMRKTDDPCGTWPQRCAEWMKRSGYLTPSAK